MRKLFFGSVFSVLIWVLTETLLYKSDEVGLPIVSVQEKI